MNSTEREVESKSMNSDAGEDQAERNEDSRPVCKNGVCELNWHPKRPQAA